MADQGSIIDKVGVQIGADLGGLKTGLDQAKSLIDTFASQGAKSLDLMALASEALVAGLAGLTAAGIIAGIKAAGDSLNSLGQTANNIGATTQELQGLSLAASHAGIDQEAFNTQLEKFSDLLVEAKKGSGGLVDALRDDQAELLNNLRHTTNLTDAMVILADRYSELTDKSAKAKIANAAFGADTQQLRDLLDANGTSLRKTANDAQGLGITFSNLQVQAGVDLNTAFKNLQNTINDSASAFNTSLKSAIVGLGPVIIGFIDLANVVLVSLNGITEAIGKLFSSTTAQEVTNLTAKSTEATLALADAQAKLANSTPGSQNFLEGQVKIRQAQLDDVNAKLQIAQDSLARQTSGQMGPPTAPAGNLPALKAKPEDEAAAAAAKLLAQRQMNQELDRYNQILREGRKVIEENATPEEALADRQLKLNRLLENGALDSETYGRAMQKAVLVASNAYATAAASIAGDLGKVFENNKAVAIAQALINTYQSVTNAWASVPFPLNIAAAAASLAAGLAQVENIRSTTKSGGGSSGSSSGGSAQAAATPIGQGSTLTVQGINPNDRFTGEQVRGLADQLLQFQRDGGTVVLK